LTKLNNVTDYLTMSYKFVHVRTVRIVPFNHWPQGSGVARTLLHKITNEVLVRIMVRVRVSLTLILSPNHNPSMEKCTCTSTPDPATGKMRTAVVCKHVDADRTLIRTATLTLTLTLFTSSPHFTGGHNHGVKRLVRETAVRH